MERADLPLQGRWKRSQWANTVFKHMELHVSWQTLTVDISPRRIATVTLNRPDRGNAFDQTMLDELAAQFAALGVDDNVRLVVLRGAGRHFCTGADLAARAADATPRRPRRRLQRCATYTPTP
jgi:enoyl-CoA hydratase/carnithine racemase